MNSRRNDRFSTACAASPLGRGVVQWLVISLIGASMVVAAWRPLPARAQNATPTEAASPARLVAQLGSPEFAAPSIEVCDLFLDRHVVEPRVYPPFAPGVARPG